MLLFIGGFLMALADSVPGVSGGTIAFLLGFYDGFINSLSDIISKDSSKRRKALHFLVRLGVGWVIGFILAVLTLTAVFETHIYEVSSLFLGFIIFSIPIVAKEEYAVLKGRYLNLIYLVLGVAIVAAITYINQVSAGGRMVDLTQLTAGRGIYVFVIAMIAISAMVLPGISGSTILLIFGIYLPVMNAIKEVLHLNLNALPVVIIFGLGVITGIVTVIKLVKSALKNFRSQTMYTILGLMIGSLYAICMGPATISSNNLPISLRNFKWVFFLTGAILVLGLEYIKEIRDNK